MSSHGKLFKTTKEILRTVSLRKRQKIRVGKAAPQADGNREAEWEPHAADESGRGHGA